MPRSQPNAKKSKPKPAPARTGRPPKGEGAAEHLMSIRWTEADKAMLDALVADERAKLEGHGILPDAAARVAAADVIRSLVRQEVQRRGLSTAA